MLFLLSDRDVLIDCLPKGGRILELGVYTANHADLMLRTVGAEEIHLVDHWSYSFEEYNPFPDVPEHFRRFETVAKGYMGPDPAATLEAAYRQTVDRFAGDDRVHIHRTSTAEAVKEFEDGYFDLIYVDASHQYEFVLRDLLEYSPKLKSGGVMIMNDVFDAPEGRDQNLGVLGAVTAFLKRSTFDPIALTAQVWSDLAISNDVGSPYCVEFVDNLLRTQYAIVEISDNMLPNYQHKVLDMGGGFIRTLPSF